MEEKESAYSAFISYRHIEPDMTVAKRLHTLIETYRIPGAVKASSGRKKMGRVFRDQEELPLSSDLSDDIQKALEQSEWLIVICSPELLASKWCMKEIDTFISLGKRDRILTVLARGTPEQSFPPQLLFEERDGERLEKEPLAANIVDDSTHGMLKKLKRESLRILAPMLDVSYDDLKQRARERRLKTILATSLSALILLGAFSLYAMNQNRIIKQQKAQVEEQNLVITEQKNKALISQSLYLADASLRAEDSGDHSLALLLALEALPEDPLNPDRPLVSDASNALYQLLLAESGFQAGASSYSSVAVIQTTNEILDYSTAVNTSEERVLRLFTNDASGYIQDYSLSSGDRVAGFDNSLLTGRPDCVELLPSGSVNAFYYGERVAICDGTVRFIHTAKRKDAADRDYSWTLAESRPEWALDYEFYYRNDGSRKENAVLLLGGDPFRIDELYWIYSAVPAAEKYADPTYLLGGLAGGNDTHNLLLWNAKTRSTVRSYETPDTVRGLAASADGTFFLASCHSFSNDLQKDAGELLLGRTASGEILLTLADDALDGSVAAALDFPQSEEDTCFSVVTQRVLMVYDYALMEWRFVHQPAGYRVLSACWDQSGDSLLIACSDHCARIISAFGVVTAELPAANALEDAHFAADDNLILLESFNAVQIYSREAGEASVSMVTSIEKQLPSRLLSCAFTPDSSRIALLYEDGVLRVYNPQTGELLYSDETGKGKFPYFNSNTSNRFVFTPDGKTLLYPISDSNAAAEDSPTTIRAVDTASWAVQKDFAPSCQYASGKLVYLNNLSLIPNGDGSLLATVSNSGTSVVTVYDAKTWEPIWDIGYSGKADEPFGSIEPFGDAVAINSRIRFNERGELLLLHTYGKEYDAIAGGRATLSVLDAATGEILSSAVIDAYDRIAMKEDGHAVCFSLDTELHVLAADGAELFSADLPNSVDDRDFVSVPRTDLSVAPAKEVQSLSIIKAKRYAMFRTIPSSGTHTTSVQWL